MKYIISFLLSILIIFSFINLSSVKSSEGFALSGGYGRVFPTSSFTQGTNNGQSISLSISRGLTKYFRLFGEYDRDQMHFNTTSFQSTIGFHHASLGLMIRPITLDRFTPYLKGNFGFAKPAYSSNLSPGISYDSWKVSWGIGGGVEYELTSVLALFMDGRYRTTYNGSPFQYVSIQGGVVLYSF